MSKGVSSNSSPDSRTVIERIESIWSGETPASRAIRALLMPASAAYGLATGVRNALYDRGLLNSTTPPIPVVSVGNLSVGGTGKTPVAAWFARQFLERGARPAMVLRGYGEDEPRVHEMLNPDVLVFVNPDRVAAVRSAASQGCDVALLDDGFQHRGIARTENIVLVNADRWQEPLRLLPAGPWREGLDALTRASMLVVTRKVASADKAVALLERLRTFRGQREGAVGSLQPVSLHRMDSADTLPLSALAGSRVLAVAGIGDPESFERQLRAAGADVELRRYTDHYAYRDSDVSNLVDAASRFDHICCTLKDAVKLGPRWPRKAPPLWYVSLRCEIEVGESALHVLIDRALSARKSTNK